MSKKEDKEDEIDLVCGKCSPKDHEGFLKAFCRCEGRNILVAKYLRKNGFVLPKKKPRAQQDYAV